MHAAPSPVLFAATEALLLPAGLQQLIYTRHLFTMDLPGGPLVCVLVILAAIFVLYQNQTITFTPSRSSSQNSYLVIGVSGGLQHGFPEHNKLHYTSGSEVVKAIYLGRALVRGYRGYLDVMQPTHRQYHEAPARINSNVFATGCQEHANEYWVYAVDIRQAMGILNNEPRFLSITPDTGLVDLTDASGKYTTELLKNFMGNEIQKQNKSNANVVAIPLVTAVWFDSTSHVPSPVIETLEDGTEVTNYPQSLAKSARLDDALPSQLPVVSKDTCVTNEDTNEEEAIGYHAKSGPEKEHWDKVRSKIEDAENNRPTEEEAQEFAPWNWNCRKKARFGVGTDMARVNYAFTAKDLKKALKLAKYDDYAGLFE